MIRFYRFPNHWIVHTRWFSFGKGGYFNTPYRAFCRGRTSRRGGSKFPGTLYHKLKYALLGKIHAIHDQWEKRL
jgi:hypothetical protein